MDENTFKTRLAEILSNSNGYYFPLDTDPEIKELITDYVDSHKTMYELAGERTEFKVTHAAQKGFTISNGSTVLRVLLDYKGKEGQIAINFPNWRGWEKVIPLDAKNLFKIKGCKDREPRKHGRYEHGYYHSFKFENKEEFIEFFNKYVAAYAVNQGRLL